MSNQPKSPKNCRYELVKHQIPTVSQAVSYFYHKKYNLFAKDMMISPSLPSTFIYLSHTFRGTFHPSQLSILTT